MEELRIHETEIVLTPKGFFAASNREQRNSVSKILEAHGLTFQISDAPPFLLLGSIRTTFLVRYRDDEAFHMQEALNEIHHLAR